MTGGTTYKDKDGILWTHLYTFVGAWQPILIVRQDGRGERNITRGEFYDEYELVQEPEARAAQPREM